MLDVRGGHLVSPRRAITHLKRADARLGAVIEQVGPCRIDRMPPTFTSLARCIVYQQLNGRAAAAIYGRLEAACGELNHDAILRLRTDRMRRIGLSGQKTEYLRSLARLTRSGRLDPGALHQHSDEEVITLLTQVKGIGVWTAHMFLMFALGRPDVLPTLDYGIRAAMKKLCQLPDLPKHAEMERIAGGWRPWRTVASWYLWRSIDMDVAL